VQARTEQRVQARTEQRAQARTEHGKEVCRDLVRAEA
jgi:hypothetical protein